MADLFPQWIQCECGLIERVVSPGDVTEKGPKNAPKAASSQD